MSSLKSSPSNHDLSYINNGGKTELSIREVVDAYRKKKNLYGIEEYDVPKFNAHLDKPRITKIYNGKKDTYLDLMVKLKSGVPPPC